MPEEKEPFESAAEIVEGESTAAVGKGAFVEGTQQGGAPSTVNEDAVAKEEAAEVETSKPEKQKKAKKVRQFNPHETARVESLAGLPLATFKQRLIAFAIDSFLLTILMFPFAVAFQLGINELMHPTKGRVDLPGVHFHYDATNKVTNDADTAAKAPLKTTYSAGKPEESENKFFDLFFVLLYFGLTVWKTNGLTLGKRIMRIRVVSLTHERITLWQSCERALGYGASALEAGFGFFQYFIYPNRTCVHDRIAETIVVQEPQMKKEKATNKK